MQVGLLIGGRDVPARDKRSFERRNPVTGEVVTNAAAARAEDAVAAADAAEAAFPAWAAMGPTARRSLLMKAADRIEDKAAEFGALVTAETGAHPSWGEFNAKLGAGHLREAAAMTTQVTGEIIPSDKPGSFAMGVRTPAGVCLGIAPWNAPVILGVRALAMPLACGNTVVLKASESSPGVHRLIGQALQEAGVPDGVVNVITHAPSEAAEVVEAFIAHPAVRRVNFTGSTAVGRIVAELAGRHLKPLLLELGGKNPLIVLDDADLDAAVDAATFSAFMHQGQICMSADRIIVQGDIVADFTAKLRSKAATLTANDGAGKGVLGALVSRGAAVQVESLLADALAKGARVLSGGTARDNFMDATLLEAVTPDMAVYQTEIFGPAAFIVPVRDDEEALRVANDTEFGLSSAVFSKDINRALNIAQRIRAGICHINGPTVQDEPQMPFGGVKSSGYGRFGGRAAIHEFTDIKWITIENQQHYPF